MEIVALVNNIRGYDGLKPVLHELSKKHNISLIYTPYVIDPSGAMVESLDFPILYKCSLPSNSYSEEILGEIVVATKDILSKAKILLISDVQNFPGADIYSAVKKLNRSIRVIGFQHGLFQIWTRPWRKRVCDFYFAYGERALEFFPHYRRESLVIAGIPKMDDLKSLNTKSDGSYILFIGQKYPSAEVIDPFLLELENHYKLPVIVRNHPQYPNLYKFRSKYPEAAEIYAKDLREQISGASIVVTTHSTCLVDALLLNKKVILLPNHGLTLLSGYKPVAKDFTVEEFEIACEKANRWDFRLWLQEFIGTLEYDSVNKTCDAILAIAGKPTIGTSLLFIKGRLLFLQTLMMYLRLGIGKLKKNRAKKCY